MALYRRHPKPASSVVGGRGEAVISPPTPLKLFPLVLLIPSISSLVTLFKVLQLRLAAPHAAFFSWENFVYPSPLMACGREAPHARVRARTHKIVHCAPFSPKTVSLFRTHSGEATLALLKPRTLLAQYRQHSKPATSVFGARGGAGIHPAFSPS